jgi:hypothetical protein
MGKTRNVFGGIRINPDSDVWFISDLHIQPHKPLSSNWYYPSLKEAVRKHSGKLQIISLGDDVEFDPKYPEGWSGAVKAYYELFNIGEGEDVTYCIVPGNHNFGLPKIAKHFGCSKNILPQSGNFCFDESFVDFKSDVASVDDVFYNNAYLDDEEDDDEFDPNVYKPGNVKGMINIGYSHYPFDQTDSNLYGFICGHLHGRKTAFNLPDASNPKTYDTLVPMLDVGCANAAEWSNGRRAYFTAQEVIRLLAEKRALNPKKRRRDYRINDSTKYYYGKNFKAVWDKPNTEYLGNVVEQIENNWK